MSPEFRGVMAAPNLCEIKAKVLHIEQSPKFPDRWHFELEILETRDVSGPNFARVGEKVKGFTFESVAHIAPQSTVSAQAEFIGDARGGQFQLSKINIMNAGSD